jgi:hypothetical protein
MPDQITKHTPAVEAIMSNITADSTTVALAGEVPLEKKVAENLPDESLETQGTEPVSSPINPIPTSEGPSDPIKLAPGEPVPDPSTVTSDTVSSTVHDDITLAGTADDSQQKFSVNPIPATAGGGNPIKLAPGEKVPDASEITTNTVNSTVRTDKESYENSDAIGAPPVLPPASTSDASPFTLTVGPESTTAQLAGQVPLEPKQVAVPDIVKESQEAAGVDPEASAIPEEIREKSAVEKELLSEVPEAPVTSDDSTVAAESATAAESSANGGIAPSVPEPVKESIVESGQSPEAAAYSEPVEEKKAVEKELLPEVKPDGITKEPAPDTTDSAATLSPPEASKEPESRDISPTTVPGSHAQPVPAVTTGGASTTTDKTSTAAETPTTPTTSATPSASKAAEGESPASPVTTDKKKKRFSILGKLKEKFSDKHKDKN